METIYKVAAAAAEVAEGRRPDETSVLPENDNILHRPIVYSIYCIGQYCIQA